jgi:hypothetical protein
MPVGASIWGPLAISVVGGMLASHTQQTNMPTVSPEYKGLQGQILNMIQTRLSQPVDLHGYEANGISTINQAYGAQKQTSDNNLSARGLSTSPVAANVDAMRSNAEAGDAATFRNSVPMLAQQIESENLAQANQILAGGTGSTGTTTSGGGAAGAVTNLAGMMGYLSGKGAFGKLGQGGAPSGGYGYDAGNGWVSTGPDSYGAALKAGAVPGYGSDISSPSFGFSPTATPGGNL